MRWRSERGAVLVHVSIALIGLLAFSAFSLDYGVLWVSRGQAQNSADAAALAGAISLAYGDPDDTARAKAVAVAAGQQNQVWGAAPDITTADVTIGPCPPSTPGPAGDTCVKADVFRNQVRGNPLPTYFARLAGVLDQGVVATATAKVLQANTASCMRPWAVPNKWLDLRDGDGGAWDWDDEYERYYTQGSQKGNPLPTPPPLDAPDADGFDNALIGTEVRLKVGNAGDGVAAGNFFPFDLPLPGGPSSGGDRYRENIGNCNSGVHVGIGDTIVTEPGNMVGPTRQGVEDLIAQDEAHWDPTAQRVVRACESGSPPCAGMSPRVVPLPVFDIEAYYQNLFAGGKGQGKFELTVANIFCFFVDRMDGKDVIGRLVSCPADYDATNGNVDENSAFLFTVLLVR